MDRKEYAVELKHGNYNCAQAVLCAFADVVKRDTEELKKLGAAFGGGMGCMEATCGALCGAQMLLGMMKYAGRPLRQDAAAVLQSFRDKCGATLCKDLKGRDTGRALCSCDDCVRNAVGILEGL